MPTTSAGVSIGGAGIGLPSASVAPPLYGSAPTRMLGVNDANVRTSSKSNGTNRPNWPAPVMSKVYVVAPTVIGSDTPAVAPTYMPGPPWPRGTGINVKSRPDGRPAPGGRAITVSARDAIAAVSPSSSGSGSQP